MLLKRIREKIQEMKIEEAKRLLQECDLSNLVECIKEFEPREKAIVFRLLDKQKALELFESLDRSEQKELIRSLEDPELISLIELISSEKRMELLDEIPAKVVKRILKELDPQVRDSINLVLGYPEDSAGRIMDTNYLALQAGRTAGEALEELRRSPLKPEHLEVIFVIGEGRKFIGFVPVSRLIKAEPESQIETLVEGRTVAVSVYDSQDKVAEIFATKRYPLIAVVDSEGRLVGSIDSETGLKLVEEREAQRLTTFGGLVSSSGPDIDIIKTPIAKIYRARVFWLLVLTFFGVLTSTFIANQEEILSKRLVLAAFIAPIIDMGGNTGSQSATMVIRALALGQVRIRLRDILFILKRDVPVAVLMGITIAVLESFLAYVTKRDFVTLDVLLVVGISMLLVVIVGSVLGVLLPFLARRLGFDPAILSGPVITSIMDFTGVLIYFGLAWVFLRHLFVS